MNDYSNSEMALFMVGVLAVIWAGTLLCEWIGKKLDKAATIDEHEIHLGM